MNPLIAETGAVLMGRRTFEMADPDSYVGDYEFQVPIFVVTHQPPAVAPKQDDRLTFTFVTDGVESAAARAKAAAGELRLDLMPVLLGSGRRLFEGPGLERLQLERTRAREVGARTSLSFHVRQPTGRSPIQ